MRPVPLRRRRLGSRGDDVEREAHRAGARGAAAAPGVEVNAAESMSGSCRFAVTSTRVPRGSVIGFSNQ